MTPGADGFARSRTIRRHCPIEERRKLERSTLFAGQAPEAFRLHPYAKINREASKEELSLTRGTSEIAYRHGMDVAMIPGDERNFKITTRSDLERFCTIVEGETK